MTYKGGEKKIDEIARELQVGTSTRGERKKSRE